MVQATIQLLNNDIADAGILIVNKLAEIASKIILIHFVLELQPVIILLNNQTSMKT